MLDAERWKKRGWALFALCFGAAVAFALWKCPYGFGSYDDAFYLTIPHRLSMGDALFVDEWHLSQLSSLLTAPLVWLYRTLTGSMDGSILAARYAYVVCHALVSLAFAYQLRGYGWAAGAAALSWFLFAPYDIMALSYNTMAMDCILLWGALLAGGRSRRGLVCAGVLLAGAVLCCPYFAAGYFLYALGVGLQALRGRGEGVFAPRRLVWLTAGVGLVSAAFAVYILSTCGVRGVLDNLPYLLSDPEHPALSPLVKLQLGWDGLLRSHGGVPWLLGGWCVLLGALLADRRRRERRGGYLAAACALALAGFALFAPRSAEVYYNAIMLPMAIVGLTAYLLCRDRPRELFVTLYLGGVVYAGAVTLGSNNYAYAISMAGAVITAASLLFLGRLLGEMAGDRAGLRRLAAGAGAATAAALLLLQLHVKAVHCFMDDSPAALTQTLQEGPARGVRTTPYRASVYQRLNGELGYYRTQPPGKLLILNERAWCYLSADPMEYAAFSAWMSGENQAALDRLEAYYRLNPDKVPDYIYLAKNALFDDPEAIVAAALAQGYTLEESELSYYLARG